MGVWNLGINASVCFMKDRSNKMRWLLLILLSSVVVAAPEQGFIRIVNAVGHGEGPLSVMVNGQPLCKDGYAPGDVTGRMMLPAGKHQLRFDRAGLAVGNARVSLESGQSLIVIPYVEAISGWQGIGPQYRLRVFRMTSEDVGERKFVTLLTVAGEELLPLRIRDLDRGWIAQPLPRLESKQIEITQLRGYLPMLLGRRRMASIPIGSAGNHIVVFYDPGDGKVVSLEFKDHQVREVE